MAQTLPIAELGQPVIRMRAAEVDDVHDPGNQALIDDMFQTVAVERGMGIAAPQVFESKRIVIVSSRPNSRYPYAPAMEPTAMINPEILWASEETEKDWEGCLTIPGIRALVPRHKKIRVRYLSRTGERMETEYSDFLARVFQHEVDHLDGIVFLDRVETNRDIVTEKEFRRIITSDPDPKTASSVVAPATG